MKDHQELFQNECQLNTCLFFTSSKLSRVMKKEADDLFRITGLSPSHAFVLYIVHLRERVHQKDVGEYLQLSPSTMTRFIDKLVIKGLVIKETEGKNVFLSITEKGRELQPRIMESWNALNSLLNGTLDENEKLTYLRLTHKILEKFDKEV